MTGLHILHVNGVYILKDDKGHYYSQHKTRAEAQARMYEMQKAEQGKNTNVE
jgi:hypothetical protein